MVLVMDTKLVSVSLQVMQFWKKAERVMVYKRQSQLDARKKEAMDKHLSFLVCTPAQSSGMQGTPPMFFIGLYCRQRL